jgi:hypothetical protein
MNLRRGHSLGIGDLESRHRTRCKMRGRISGACCAMLSKSKGNRCGMCALCVL